MDTLHDESQATYQVQGDEDAIIARALEILRERTAVGEALTSPADAGRRLRLELAEEKRESFVCLFLDNKHRILGFETMFYGTVDGAAVHPREIVRRALELNAAAVVLGHNHPSGVSDPSEADRRITVRISDALALVDVRVLDHFVVGRESMTSMAEAGMM